ncbi:hypothetical protein ES703_114424 [subsurface metagenome]
MKRFFKKRWHHLPIGIITAVLLACLLAGSAFAAYNFFTFDAQVEVLEAIDVSFTPEHDTWPGDINYDEGTQTITITGLMPGSWKCGYLQLTNKAMDDLTVDFDITPNPSDYDIDIWVWGHDIGIPNPPYDQLNGFSLPIPGLLSGGLNNPGMWVVVEAGHETPPATYSFAIELSRS